MKKSITFFVHNLYYLGGTTRAITNSANILNRVGYDVRIISVFKGHTRPFFPLDSKIKIMPLIDYTNKGKGRLKNIFFNRLNHFLPKLFATKEIHPDEPGIRQFSAYVEKKIIRAIQAIDTDVLISTRASYNLLVAKYAPGKVYLIAQEHMLFTKHTLALQEAITNSYSRFDRVTTLTNADAKHYESFLSSEKIFVLPNSLPSELECVPVTKKERTIISAGRFEEEKGFDLLIEAIARIKEEIGDWKVRVYGEGPEKLKLSQIIKDHELEKTISLEPTTKNLHKKMLTSKVYVLPSRFEGFGMVLIEAMATSNAVVAFDCPVGPREIITHEKDGLLIEEANIIQLADEIKKLINNENRISQLADGGLQRSQKYQQQSIVMLWHKLLQ